MKEYKRHWYITLIAAWYLVLCSVAVVRYVVVDFGSDVRAVPAIIQLLCLGNALAAGAYFVKPRAGHKGLILFTVATLVAIGTTDAKATFFHLVMLCLLLLPYIRSRAHLSGNTEPGAAPTGGPPSLLGNSGAAEGRHR